MTFDKQNLRQIRNDINVALAAVAAKHGIKLDIGNIRFSSDRFTTKLTATSNDVKIHTPVVTSHRIKLGETMALINGKMFLVVDYKPNRPEYPYVGQGRKGGRWKLRASEVYSGIEAAKAAGF